jgi:hypothetical protein
MKKEPGEILENYQTISSPAKSIISGAAKNFLENGET